MRGRELLGFTAIFLSALTVLGVLWYVYFVPYNLKVAVGPAYTEPTELLTSMSESLDRDNAAVRLTLVPHDDLAETSVALDARRVDLAVVRTDLGLPSSGLGVAVLHQYVMLILARPQANIRQLTDLRNHSVGIVGTPANTALFEALLSSHELSSRSVRIVALKQVDEIPSAILNSRIDALFVVGPRGGRLVTQSFQTFRAAIKASPVFVAIGGAQGLVARNPTFAAGEIAPGELELAPLMPNKEIQTLTFPALLVASRRARSAAVEEFTRQLFSLRHALLAQNPAAGRIEKLSTDRGESFAVHPGAATYYDAEEAGLLSGLSDWFWVGMLGLGGISSIGAWILSRLFPRRREMALADFTELQELLASIRKAKSIAELAQLEREVDQIVRTTAQLLFDGSIDDVHQPAFDLILARIPAVVEERREELASGQNADVPQPTSLRAVSTGSQAGPPIEA